MNHIHIGAKDLKASKSFYESYFDFKIKFDHEGGVFLENSEGFLLAIDPVEEAPDFPSWFHLGFCYDSPEKVKKIYDRMKASGVSFAKDYQDYNGEAVAFYAIDPDGTKIEVSWHKE